MDNQKPDSLLPLVNPFRPIPFEFETRLSPDECRLRLERKFNRGSSLLTNVEKAYVHSIDGGKLGFTLYRQFGRGIAVHADGVMEKDAQQLTKIKGAVRVSSITYITLLLIEVVALLYVFLAPRSVDRVLSGTFALLFIVAVVFALLFTASKRGNVIAEVKALLGK
jgi:hypothetical protein